MLRVSFLSRFWESTGTLENVQSVSRFVLSGWSKCDVLQHLVTEGKAASWVLRTCKCLGLNDRCPSDLGEFMGKDHTPLSLGLTRRTHFFFPTLPFLGKYLTQVLVHTFKSPILLKKILAVNLRPFSSVTLHMIPPILGTEYRSFFVLYRE